VVEGGRLTPALVSPVSGVAVHAGEKAGCGTARARECGTCVGIGPGVTTVGRSENLIGPIAESATHLVHSCEVHVAGNLVAGDLDVADEGRGDAYRTVPRGAVVARVGGKKSASADIEVVPGNVHPVGEGRGWVVVRPARIPVVLGVVMNAEMGPASRVRGIGGLVAAQALTAAGRIEPDGEPGGVSAIVQKNRVALGTSKGALTAGVGDAGEGSAAVGGYRRTGYVNRILIAASRVVVGDNNLLRVIRVSPGECL
jgi:hypothetical protein